MSVLQQIVEKLSYLKRLPTNVNNLTFEAETKELALLLPDLQKFNIKAEDGANFSVYLITETPDSDHNDLNFTASLGGFYNSRYVFEVLKYYQVKVPIGHYRFFVRKRCVDLPENIFMALVIWWPISTGRNSIKTALTLDEAYTVAETLSTFHSPGFQRPAPRSKEIVNENHDFVQDFMTKHLRNNFNHFLHVLFTHNHSRFSNPDRAHQTVHALYEKFSSFKECAKVDDDLVKVLTHGNLCAQNITFNRDDELTGILNWEHSSFGHVGLDLTYLMTSSLSPRDRRQNYLRVLRHYYYSLVDKHTVPFNMNDLKSFYRHFLKYAVFFNIFDLVFTLDSGYISDNEKTEAVNRWEQTLYDAYDVETNSYISDNEDIRII